MIAVIFARDRNCVLALNAQGIDLMVSPERDSDGNILYKAINEKPSKFSLEG